MKVPITCQGYHRDGPVSTAESGNDEVARIVHRNCELIAVSYEASFEVRGLAPWDSPIYDIESFSCPAVFNDFLIEPAAPVDLKRVVVGKADHGDIVGNVNEHLRYKAGRYRYDDCPKRLNETKEKLVVGTNEN